MVLTKRTYLAMIDILINKLVLFGIINKDLLNYY